MNIISVDTLKEKRRQGTIESQVPYVLNGKTEAVDKKIVNGEMETVELAVPIGEMLSSDNARKELMKKVVLDVELGREQVPLLFSTIYEKIQDPNFPKEFEAKWAQYGSVIFFEHLEGGEVKFGSLQAEQGPIARIKGYSAGFEYTKEIEIFNQTFNFELLNRAFGEAHNAILNHLHFGPIVGFKYKDANKTAAQYVDYTGKKLASADGSHYTLSLRQSIRQGLIDARVAKRAPKVLLAHSANQEDIQEALASFTLNGTPYRALDGVTDIIFYDGWEAQVGKKTHTYAGVPTDKLYLIRPKKGFKELVKQELEVNSTMGDMTRLVESQVVGDFWRGVFAAVEENVQEITLPAKG